MSRINKKYTKDYKEEAVKLSREIGITKVALELGIPRGTLAYGLQMPRKVF
jgi:transposase-like protein